LRKSRKFKNLEIYKKFSRFFFKYFNVSGIRHFFNSRCSYIEVGSFVNPKAVPRMADSARVFKNIERDQNTVYAALTPNLKVFISKVFEKK